MRQVLRIIGSIFGSLLLLVQVTPTWGLAQQQPSIVIDADKGTILFERDATKLWYPASLTKMMTLYLTFAAIDAETLKLEDELTASAHVAAQPDSRIGLDKGDRIAVREAILAVITQSANDAAVVLAEKLGGDEAAFAGMMTQKAQQLGMSRTVFRNATGLPHNEQTTTARDMALLAQALVRDFAHYYHFFNARSFTYKRISYGNINGILTSYPGADGLKTGFTCGSGYNLVASARRDDRRLIGVVLGAANGGERTNQMIKLLNAAFANADKVENPVTLAALEPAPGTEDSSPPFRLKPSECSLGTGIRGPKLPGWGLLFGAFRDQAQAKRHVEGMRARLKPVLKGGQVAVVKRQVEDVTTWKAMLVGLKQVDAVNACLHLIKTNNICLVQSPQVLNPSSRLTTLAQKHKKNGKLSAAAPPPYLP